MDKKSTLILISILHICILAVCILTVRSNQNAKITVAHVSSDTKAPAPKISLPQTAESETETEIEAETETETEIETETETEAEIEAETETDLAKVLYNFDYNGKKLNLNIRNAPSLEASIIGKVPPHGSGKVLELTNEEWVLVDYKGLNGYCSKEHIVLSPAGP